MSLLRRALGWFAASWVVAAVAPKASTEEVAAGEGDFTCPADGSGPPSCRQKVEVVGAAVASDPPRVQVHMENDGPRADIITQEIAELKKLINGSKERLELLHELKDALRDALRTESHSLPAAHAQVLSEPMPLLSEVAMQGDRVPTASADDFLVTKAVIPNEEEVTFVKFMPTHSPRSVSASEAAPTQSTLPSALLVAAQADGSVQLFAPTGDLVLSFSAGHEQPVTHIAVTTMASEDHLLASADAGGAIRVHKVGVKQRRTKAKKSTPKKEAAHEVEPDVVDDDRISVHAAASLNVTVQLTRALRMPEGSEVTALAMGGQGGSKYVIVGDSEGQVSLFMRNGTLRKRIDTTPEDGEPARIDSLTVQSSTVLFQSGGDWGFIDADKFHVRRPDCPKRSSFETVTLDTQLSARVLAADSQGTIWVYNAQKKDACILEARYVSGAARGYADLASIWGYAIGLEKPGASGEPVSTVAINMSMVSRGRGSNKIPDVIPGKQASLVWRRDRPPVRAWSLLRRSKEGDLMALLSEDGHEIEIVEVLMQVYTAPVTDSLGNFQMPVIAVAVLLVSGYQFMKQKGKQNASFANKGKSNFDEDFLKKKFADMKK